MVEPRSLDEMIWRLGQIIRTSRVSDWERRFLASILKQAKRPNWHPSAKQLHIIHQIMSEPPDAAMELLEHEGG